jgi:adenylate kinase family enzyme
MTRIAIIGRSGSGKSTLAVKLGQRLAIPVIHLDALFWRPGWVESDAGEFRTRLAEALATDPWITDGDFAATADIRLALADTIIWVDQPRLRCMRRALQRAITWFGRSRRDLAPGCPERIDLKFLRYIWTWDRVTRPKVNAAIETFGVHARVIRLRSDREIAMFLHGVDQSHM